MFLEGPVWCSRDVGAGWVSLGGVQDHSDSRTGFAAVAAAGEDCLLLAWAQALQGPMGSPTGPP